MSNVHGLHDRSNNSDEDDTSRDENNRYVGGVNSRGGGSGLAVEPSPSHPSSPPPPSSILSSASQNAPTADASEIQRRIVMYRSGFVVDDGPYRRLDDPANAEFLRSLAKGVTPKELRGEGGEDVVVGLEDRRGVEWEEEQRDGGGGSGSGSGGSGFQSFSGTGQSLVSSTDGESAASTTGVITPSTNSDPPPDVDSSRPTTMVQIRLLNGRRLRVRLNTDDPVSVLARHIDASGDGGTEAYLLSGGYPPRILDDMALTVEEAGLKGAQVVQKKP